MKFYFCPICKNLVVTINDSGVNPSCCGQPMKELVANTVDAAFEKHVPHVVLEGRNVEVEVGSVPHPMTEEHYIDFVVLETNLGFYTHHLDKTKAAKTTFHLLADEKPLAVYEYCNLHGLWKTNL
jgi:superoxide reductase